MLLSRCGSAQTARPVLACILFLCFLPTLSSAAYAGSDEEPWLLVDT